MRPGILHLNVVQVGTPTSPYSVWDKHHCPLFSRSSGQATNKTQSRDILVSCWACFWSASHLHINRCKFHVFLDLLPLQLGSWWKLSVPWIAWRAKHWTGNGWPLLLTLCTSRETDGWQYVSTSSWKSRAMNQSRAWSNAGGCYHPETEYVFVESLQA